MNVDEVLALGHEVSEMVRTAKGLPPSYPSAYSVSVLGERIGKAASISESTTRLSRVMAGAEKVEPEVLKILSNNTEILSPDRYLDLGYEELVANDKDYLYAGYIYETGARDGQLALAKEVTKNAVIGAAVGAGVGYAADAALSFILDSEPEPVKSAAVGAAAGAAFQIGYTLFRILR